MHLGTLTERSTGARGRSSLGSRSRITRIVYALTNIGNIELLRGTVTGREARAEPRARPTVRARRACRPSARRAHLVVCPGAGLCCRGPLPRAGSRVLHGSWPRSVAALPARRPRSLAPRPRTLGRRDRFRGDRTSGSSCAARTPHRRAVHPRTRPCAPRRSGCVDAARRGVGAGEADRRAARDRAAGGSTPKAVLAKIVVTASRCDRSRVDLATGRQAWWIAGEPRTASARGHSGGDSANGELRATNSGGWRALRALGELDSPYEAALALAEADDGGALRRSP
jgi:hypothetical protein